MVTQQQLDLPPQLGIACATFLDISGSFARRAFERRVKNVSATAFALRLHPIFRR